MWIWILEALVVSALYVYEKTLNSASLWWLRIGCDSKSSASIKMLNMHHERVDQASKWQWMWCSLRDHNIDPHTISRTTQTRGNNPKRHQIQHWLHMNQISNPEKPAWHDLNDMIWIPICMTHDITKENTTLYVAGVAVFPYVFLYDRDGWTLLTSSIRQGLSTQTGRFWPVKLP